MSTGTRHPHRAPGDADAFDDLFVEPPLNAAGIDLHLKPGAPRPVAQLDHPAHELSESAAESVSRLLIRLVPSVYGGLLGYLAGALVPGLAVGVLASLAFDLKMGKHSLLRRLRCCLPRVPATGFRQR